MAATIAINGAADIYQTEKVTTAIIIVLLTAVKDRATRVRLDPSVRDQHWKLRYRVGGVWYEMVPIPLFVPISQTVRRLAGLGSPNRLARWLGRVLRVRPARGGLRLEICGKPVEVSVAIEPAPQSLMYGEPVRFRLPKESLPAEEARRIVVDFFHDGDKDAGRTRRSED